MLFDLRGKRKRAIQVTYAGLAVLMGSGLVLFGIGGSGSGLFDAFKGGGGGGGSSQFDDQATKIASKLRRDPKNQALLVDLVRARFQAANAELTANTDSSTGQVSLTDKAISEASAATAAWERYIKLNPKRPDPGIAAQVTQPYEILIQAGVQTGNGVGIVQAAKLAARAEEIVVKHSAGPQTLFNLAQYRFIAGDFSAGDKAASLAVEKTPKASKAGIRQQIASARKRAKLFAVQLAKQTKQHGKPSLSQNPFGTPLGGFSGGGSGAP